MKGKMVLTVLLSLALVFSMAAVSCDNGVAPDIGDKELDGQITGFDHPGGVLSGGDDKFDLEKLFPSAP